MNVIDSCQFGLIVVSGREYSSDVIIFPDRAEGDWWRKSGHELCLDDIGGVIAENPEVLVVGTGMSGMMEVLPEVKQAAQARGIRLITETTDKAWHTYNRLCYSQRVVAAFHLTC
ncbi:Mth938-like domain-containing protein [Chloroflexota bacterium]